MGPKGITLVKDIFSEDTELRLFNTIEKRGWKRMSCGKDVQEFGYDYHFRRRCGHDEASFDPVKSYTTWLKERDGCEALDLHACPGYVNEFSTVVEMVFGHTVNQIIVNRYPKGEGIRPHTDKQMPCDWFVSLSLGADTTMVFRPLQGGDEYALELPRRSLLLVEGEAFHKWKHGIEKDATRGDLRISITGRALSVRHFW